MFSSLNASYSSQLYLSRHVSFSCFAPKIHQSTFLLNRLDHSSFVLDRVHISEAYVSTGLMSTLYIILRSSGTSYAFSVRGNTSLQLGCIQKYTALHIWGINYSVKGKGKAVPLQAWSGPEGSRKLRFPDFMTMAQDGGKVVSLTHRPVFTPRKYSWYSFLLEAESTPRP